MQLILDQLLSYLQGLEWGYIFTFICLAYGFNNWQITAILEKWGVNLQVRYRTLIVGVGYAVLLYFLRGYDLYQVESLAASLVFAMIFHKLILEKLLQSVLPDRIAQHLGKEKPDQFSTDA